MQSAANHQAASSDQPDKFVEGHQTQGSIDAPVVPEFDVTHGAEAEQARRIAEEEDALTSTE